LAIRLLCDGAASVPAVDYADGPQEAVVVGAAVSFTFVGGVFAMPWIAAAEFVVLGLSGAILLTRRCSCLALLPEIADTEVGLSVHGSATCGAFRGHYSNSCNKSSHHPC